MAARNVGTPTAGRPAGHDRPPSEATDRQRAVRHLQRRAGTEPEPPTARRRPDLGVVCAAPARSSGGVSRDDPEGSRLRRWRWSCRHRPDDVGRCRGRGGRRTPAVGHPAHVRDHDPLRDLVLGVVFQVREDPDQRTLQLVDQLPPDGLLHLGGAPAVLIPSRLRPAPSLRLRLARERDPPEPDPFAARLGRSSAARGDSWSEQYDCCSDNSDDTGSQQSHGTPQGSSRPLRTRCSRCRRTRCPPAHAGPLRGLSYLSGRQPNTPVVVLCARAVEEGLGSVRRPPHGGERIPSPGVSVAEPSDPG